MNMSTFFCTIFRDISYILVPMYLLISEKFHCLKSQRRQHLHIGCDWLPALDLMQHSPSQHKHMQCLGVQLSCTSKLCLVKLCLVAYIVLPMQSPPCQSPPCSHVSVRVLSDNYCAEASASQINLKNIKVLACREIDADLDFRSRRGLAQRQQTEGIYLFQLNNLRTKISASLFGAFLSIEK